MLQHSYCLLTAHQTFAMANYKIAKSKVIIAVQIKMGILKSKTKIIKVNTWIVSINK